MLFFFFVEVVVVVVTEAPLTSSEGTATGLLLVGLRSERPPPLPPRPLPRPRRLPRPRGVSEDLFWAEDEVAGVDGKNGTASGRRLVFGSLNLGEIMTTPTYPLLNTALHGTFLEISDDKRTVRYTGSGSHNNDVGVRSAKKKTIPEESQRKQGKFRGCFLLFFSLRKHRESNKSKRAEEGEITTVTSSGNKMLIQMGFLLRDDDVFHLLNDCRGINLCKNR